MELLWKNSRNLCAKTDLLILPLDILAEEFVSSKKINSNFSLLSSSL